MCGRYVTEEDISPQMKAIYALVRNAYPDISLHSGEIYPTHTVPMILGQGGEMCLSPATWGFRGGTGRRLLINARAETVLEKPMFRESFMDRRCIIPTNGYFEWSGEGQKYRFNIAAQDMVYLAGVYRPEGQGISFVVLTTTAHMGVREIHSRMPLLLSREQLSLWMNDHDFAKAHIKATMPSVTMSLVG